MASPFMFRFSSFCWFAALTSTSVCIARADSEPPDREQKRNYYLFNSTPAKFVRELSTDRPDKTESPYTVDAGHFQVEADLINYTYDRWSKIAVQTEILQFASANLKVGLRHDLDLQLVLPGYERLRTSEHGRALEKTSGFGDLITRLKFNIFGNEGGPVAFALMPALKIPTGKEGLGNKALEGGMIFPVAAKLPFAWGIGFMTEIDFNRNSNDRRYHTEFVNSITFDHHIAGKVDGYLEFYSAFNTEAHSEWIGTIDVGLLYLLSANVQLDAGVNIGVTRSADDFNPFAGITFRF